MADRETRTFREIVIRDIIIALLVTVLGGVIVALIVGEGRFGSQATKPTETASAPEMATVPAQAASQATAPPTLPPDDRVATPEMRFVFLGYPQQGQPQSGMGIISGNKLSNVQNIDFLTNGGELSPNGLFIAYDCGPHSERGLHIVDVDGSNARMVKILSGDFCTDVRWSPDNTKLSYQDPKDYSLHIVDISTGKDSQIPNTLGAEWHWWSPAGNEIVYGLNLYFLCNRDHTAPQCELSNKAFRLLYITDLSGNSRQLTLADDFEPCANASNQVDAWAPTWSPDGTTIAFTECSKLYSINRNGSNLIQLADSAYSPRWSPDSKWIIFIHNNDVLTRISSDGRAIEEMGTLPYWGGPFSIGPLVNP
ncbi:MAG TPA: hypothetical protein VK206_04265 [Anaerolineales bacterium]|nr:hypothetical protein [Anaerolineales bacterium]